MKIENKTAENGFITDVEQRGRTETRIHNTLDEALESICTDSLSWFEGRSHYFLGDRYCDIKLKINRTNP